MKPAILGGSPRFPDGVPIARPAVPPLDAVVERLRPSYESGMLTNGVLVRELEAEAARRLGVDHVVAVASCTSGLLLVIQALAGNGSTAVLPSFTFSATAHAAAWNGLAPVFAECDPDSFQLDVADAATRLEGADAAVLLATHVFGAPAPAEAIEKLGADHGVPVVFDAAHGFGASRAGRPLGGFGSAEIFSLSPTKPVVAGEGGIVATDDGELAERLRIGRDYGNPGDYDTRFAGLNARMSELHAALAIESLAELDDNLATRREHAAAYAAGLASVPGITPQAIDEGDTSTFKDYTVAVGPEFGMSRDTLVRALRKEGIDTRCYFSPPVHRHQAYASETPPSLPVTDSASDRVVSLPMFSSLDRRTTSGIVEVMAMLQEQAEAVSAAAP